MEASVVSLLSEDISQENDECFCKPSRAMEHTSATRNQMIIMAVLFIIQFAFNVSLTSLLYTNGYYTYFGISIGFVILFYIIGCFFATMRASSRDSFLFCILFILCAVILLPICLPFIICIFCVNEAFQQYTKVQLLVNILPLTIYLSIQFIFNIVLISIHSLNLTYQYNNNSTTYDLSWILPVSILLSIIYYIDIFILIMFHGKHALFTYYKSALFMLSSISTEMLLIILFILIKCYINPLDQINETAKNIFNYGLLNYVFLSLPMSTVYCVWKWIKKIENMDYIDDLVHSNLIINYESLYNKFYCYFHLLTHTALPQISIPRPAIQKSMNRKSTASINMDDFSEEYESNNNNVLRNHCNSDILCIKYQCEYFKKRNQKKQFKYINNISRHKLPYLSWMIRYRMYISNKRKCPTLRRIIYILSRIYSYLLPFYFFFYIYLYCLNDFNDIYDFGKWIIDKNNKYEHLLITILMLFYTIFLIIKLKMIYIFLRIEYYYGYFMKMAIDWNSISYFSTCLKRNEIIIDVIKNEKIAVVIISYLKNEYTSNRWLFTDNLPQV